MIRKFLVTAEWALWGKSAQDTEYGLLNFSKGVVGRENFFEGIVRYSPGSLEFLPQATLSWLPYHVGSYYMAIAIHQAGGHRHDASGREIVFTNYFCVPYRQLAPGAIPYTVMYEEFRMAQLPAAGREPIKLKFTAHVPGIPEDNEQASRTAALLLTGRPVCVVGADSVNLSDRLRFIDSVMSLLPYGMRARMSAATLVSSTFREHKLRLFFASAPRPGDHVVTWGRHNNAPIGDSDAQEYLDLLHEKRHPVAWLASVTEPMGFRRADVHGLLWQFRLAPRTPAPQTPATENPRGHAFISYVREDSDHVDNLQHRLEGEGIQVWRDRKDLWPGEDWRRRIRQAIQEDALVFIACFSQQSLARKTSFQNEELTWAIEQLRRRRPDDPWLIPVRFSDCGIPDLDIGADRTLRSLQRADLFGDHADEDAHRLVAAVLRILGREA